MGVFKVNGKDIVEAGEVINNDDIRAKSIAFSSGKLNVSGLSDNSKTLANASGWGAINIVGDKLKVNGVADSVARRGTRPRVGQTAEAAGFSITISTTTHRFHYDAETDTIKQWAVYDNDAMSDSLINTVTGKSVLLVEIIGGGGGGGGGKYINSGGGGGGGATIGFLWDFNKLPDLYIYHGTSGNGGGGDDNGSHGEDSWAGTTNSKGSALYVAGGGGKGYAASGGGDGGYAGTAVVSLNLPDGTKLVWSASGGYGGDAKGFGGNSGAVTIGGLGGDESSSTVSVFAGLKGSTSKGSNIGGTGGSCGSPLKCSVSNVGGQGGDDQGNGRDAAWYGGGGGGGGGRALGQSNKSGGDGYVGLFRIWY